MGDEQRAIFALLSGRAPAPDEIAGRTEIPARRVNTALTLLQAQGYLNELPPASGLPSLPSALTTKYVRSTMLWQNRIW